MAGMNEPKVIGCMDDDVEEAAETLLRKYYIQQGGLIDDVFMQQGQYGGWLGEKTLKRFYRGLPVPVKESLQMIRDVAMGGIRDYAGDISRGEDWRKSGMRRISETGGTIASRLGQKLSKMMSGRGRRRNKRRRGTTKRGSSTATSGRVGRKRKKRTTRRKTPARKTASKRKKTKRKTTKRRTSSKQKGYGDIGIGASGWL
jgi:hypothetical protein